MTVSHLGGEHEEYVIATWFNEAKQEFSEETFLLQQVTTVPPPA